MPGFLLTLFLSLILFLSPFIGAFPDSLHGQAPIDPSNLSGDYDPGDAQGEFHGQKVTSLTGNLASTPHFVLGLTDKPKRIEVDLATQHLYAYEGNHKIYDFVISSGKWGKTPTGTFSIWGKFRYTKMSGGSKALHTYYYLPNVPYVMFFSNDKIAASRGFSLHGTYWHNNFGTPMSHGCVNMRTEDAGVLFYWTQPTIGDLKTTRATATDPGTQILNYGTAPQS